MKLLTEIQALFSVDRYPTVLCRELEQMRLSAGLSQTQLGDRMNPPRTGWAVSKIEERGDRLLQLGDIEEYLNALP